MPTPAEIIAALGDISDIESESELRSRMVGLFTEIAHRTNRREDPRPSQIFRKMTSTVDTIPYNLLVEFGHN